MPRYTVYQTVTEYKIEVEANSKEEAIDKAMLKCDPAEWKGLDKGETNVVYYQAERMETDYDRKVNDGL